MIVILVHTNFQYSDFNSSLLGSFHDSLIAQSLLTANTYNPKSASAVHIAKYFSIVE